MGRIAGPLLLTLLATCLLATCLLATPALSGRAEAQASDLDGIRELIFRARFDEAIQGATQYLERTDLSASDRNAGLEVLATAQIANRSGNEATATLRTLYSRDPGHRLTDADASPPVISAFARAREAHPTPVTVSLDHIPPTLERREPPTLSVRVTEGADAVSEVRLVYRIASEGTSRVVMTPRDDGSFNARIPVVGDATSPTDVAYHVVAMAPSLTPLATIGSEAEPLQLQIPAEARDGPVAVAPTPTPAGPAEPPPERGIAEQWWFWTIIGVIVVGAAVTTGVLLGPAQQGPEAGSLGTSRLMLRF